MYAFRIAFPQRPEAVKFFMARRQQLLKDCNITVLLKLRESQMEAVTDFIHKCCTTQENVDALVIRAAKSITKQSSTIINILQFQTNVLAKVPNAPLLTPAELVQVLDSTDVIDAPLHNLLNESKNLADLRSKSAVYGAQRTEVPIDDYVKEKVFAEVMELNEEF